MSSYAAALIVAGLAAAALAFACSDGDDAAATPTAPSATETAQPTEPDTATCIDREALTPPASGSVWEVGAGPVYFRFGLPDEALQSGEACATDLGLVVIRVTGAGPGGPVTLRAERAADGTVLDVEAEPVTVPGEEDAGAFFNASVELPGPGSWELSVELPDGRRGAYGVVVGGP